MRNARVHGLLVAVLVMGVDALGQIPQRGADVRPQAIVLPHPTDHTTPPTQIGLLYTPDVLAALAATSPQDVTPRITRAIAEQTPLVVLWTIPPPGNGDPWPRPFATVIVDGRGDSFGSPNPGHGVRIDPLWVEQDADDLRRLDRRTTFADVGIMAAYPRTAFVPGRLITVYRSLPSEPGRLQGVQRYGLIQWNGVAVTAGK